MLNELNNKVMSTQTQVDPYNKVIATIKSCKTKKQLKGAINMVKNFEMLYGLVGYPKVLSYNINKELNIKKQQL